MREKETVKKKAGEKLVSIKNAAHTLRVSVRHIKMYISENQFEVFQNQLNQDCIKDRDFQSLLENPTVRIDVLETFAGEVKRRYSERDSGKDDLFARWQQNEIKEQYKNIEKLEKIHVKYHSEFDVLYSETSETAAYIIFSKVIGLLKMTCMCLEKDFWDASILLRPIDEAVNLAQYFALDGHTEEGKKHLFEWFRKNESPNNSVCRKSIDKHLKPSIEEFEKQYPEFSGVHSFLDTSRKLYSLKSKPIHNTLNGIIETYKAKLMDDKLFPVGFDYGRCTYPRKMLGITFSFHSSVLTAYQGFLMCFHGVLSQEDKNLVITLMSQLHDAQNKKTESMLA